jgi:hypothetical protein
MMGLRDLVVFDPTRSNPAVGISYGQSKLGKLNGLRNLGKAAERSLIKHLLMRDALHLTCDQELSACGHGAIFQNRKQGRHQSCSR